MCIESPCFFGVQDVNGTYEVSIEITNDCNLKCRHCMNRSGMDATYTRFSLDDINSLIKEFVICNVTEVYITGGEPTLYPHFSVLIEKLSLNNIAVLLATNAYDISNHLDVIKKYVDCVFVSIDGTPSIHDEFRGVTGAYQCTMNNIRLLLTNKIPVRLSTVVSKSNIDYLDNIITAVKDLGVFEIHFTVLVNVGRATENQDTISESEYRALVGKINALKQTQSRQGFAITMRRNGKLSPETGKCYGGIKMAHINAEGVVFPCSYIAKSPIADDYSAKWRAGNLAKCIEKIRTLENICEQRNRYFAHTSCIAMALINSDNKNILSADPLDIIFGDEH